MIDIVVPFYNDKDEKWRNVLRKYLSDEKTEDRQATGDERYRDADCFQYWFRCVEQNCPWVNKIFLIVACESQLPKWLNRDNPKLRIVCHEEYIPKELLPTFNTLTIEFFISLIKDLSDNYIYCNDDYYFLNPTNKELLFVNDLPVYKSHKVPIEKFGEDYLNASDGTFYQVLNNGMDLQLKISGDKAHWYALDHIPVPHKKEFEKEIIRKYYYTFIEANKHSRFRNRNMYSNHVFVCLYKDLKPYYVFDYMDSYYVTMRKDINFDDHAHCKMICFNDTEQLNSEDFKNVKERMIKFFEDRFPNKSTFEK